LTSDTIAAIATPLGGEGGIGVIRLSGPDSANIIQSIFKPSSNNKLKSHTIQHGWIVDNSSRIDQVVVSYMASPRSYTGEDVVEISCHGGGKVLNSVLELTLNAGGRLAQRGEFTKRAFLNGKIDLAQAEAVIDLIMAKTKQGALFAASQLSGSLSHKISGVRNILKGLLAEIEASIDFPDEISDVPPDSAKNTVNSAINTIKGLIQTADLGKAYREGISLAIIGKPNVGKSCLLNALLKEDRAIVSEEPGTTRDIIEETLNIKGIPFIINDTAGIRDPLNKVESIGIDRARNAIDKADAVLLVIDISSPLTPDDISLIRDTNTLKRVIALNKADLAHMVKTKDIVGKAGGNASFAEISALKGDGVGELENLIFNCIVDHKVVAENTEVMVNLRHKEALIRARDLLENCLKSLNDNMQADFVSIDLKGAIAALGEVTGDVVSDEIIDSIFESFCVGK
jgi:tRNA modification GTPase